MWSTLLGNQLMPLGTRIASSLAEATRTASESGSEREGIDIHTIYTGTLFTLGHSLHWDTQSLHWDTQSLHRDTQSLHWDTIYTGTLNLYTGEIINNICFRDS